MDSIRVLSNPSQPTITNHRLPIEQTKIIGMKSTIVIAALKRLGLSRSAFPPLDREDITIFWKMRTDAIPTATRTATTSTCSASSTLSPPFQTKN
jgi:hypothetical protein